MPTHDKKAIRWLERLKEPLNGHATETNIETIDSVFETNHSSAEIAHSSNMFFVYPTNIIFSMYF